MILPFLLPLLLFFSGCQQSPPSQITTFEGTAMTINYKVTIGHTLEPREIELIRSIVNSSFEEINSVYNRWNPKSELSKLNQFQSTEPTPISINLYSFLERTGKFVELSEGRFDPTIEPLLVLWKNSLEHNELPSEKALAEARSSVGWEHIHLENGQFRKDNPLTQIDLGGIAKGYAVDLIVERLVKSGYTNILVEWGGEIRANGHHPEKRPWKVFIARLNDSNPDHSLAEIILEDEAIATSGDYNQFWIYKNGNATTVYTHVINPKTGHPLAIKKHSIASVSVLAPTCTDADALATAAMVFHDIDRAREWIAKIDPLLPKTEFWFVTRDTK